jgi:hypothetical protein
VGRSFFFPVIIYRIKDGYKNEEGGSLQLRVSWRAQEYLPHTQAHTQFLICLYFKGVTVISTKLKCFPHQRIWRVSGCRPTHPTFPSFFTNFNPVADVPLSDLPSKLLWCSAPGAKDAPGVRGMRRPRERGLRQKMKNEIWPLRGLYHQHPPIPQFLHLKSKSS